MARHLLLTQLTIALVAVLAAARPEKTINNGRARATIGPATSARLMKELVELYKSPTYKSGMVQVDLVEDNLAEWEVKLFIVDPANKLHADLQRWKAEGRGEDYILLRVSFGADYPAGPPFVRVVRPVFDSRFCFRGGSICAHLLSRHGWIPECTFESLILSLVDIMIQGKTRLQFEEYTEMAGEIYNEQEARENFEDAMREHHWDQPSTANDRRTS